MSYPALINTIIDKNNSDFDDFPSILDGEIYLGGDAATGWHTRPTSPVLNVNKISKLEMYYQAKADGLWTAFEAILEANPDAKMEWELASYLDIARPTVQSIGTAMGMTGAQLQTFFNNAKGRTS